jgi:protein TonB
MAASGAEGGAAKAVIPARPRYRTNPPPVYPEMARRRQMEGTVVLKALVNTQGRVDALNVQSSSGHSVLDRAALRAVRNWIFIPGKQNNNPITMAVLVPVRFALR